MIAAWVFTLNWAAINKAAAEHGLDEKLIAAIAMQESKGDPLAYRHEPKSILQLDVPHFAALSGVSQDSELMMQRTSFGILQILGVVARELGFVGNLLDLVYIDKGLHYGCLQIKRLQARHALWTDVVASYNAGSPRRTPAGAYVNQDYVDGVSGYFKELGGVL